jgi:hypothetical protein
MQLARVYRKLVIAGCWELVRALGSREHGPG